MKGHGNIEKNEQQSQGQSYVAENGSVGGNRVDWYAMTLSNDCGDKSNAKCSTVNSNSETKQLSNESDLGINQKSYNRDYEANLKIVEQGIQSMDLKYSYQQQYRNREMAGAAAAANKRNTWARIASQPAKMQMTFHNSGFKKKGPGMPPGPIVPGKHNIDMGAWDTVIKPAVPVTQPLSIPKPQLVVPVTQPRIIRNTTNVIHNEMLNSKKVISNSENEYSSSLPISQHDQKNFSYDDVGDKKVTNSNLTSSSSSTSSLVNTNASIAENSSHPVLEELRVKNNYNPKEFDLMPANARFFVIKSYSEDDIHRSIKYEIWCSTEHGNQRLDKAFNEQENKGPIYLFFSVNGSGHFCGVAQMISNVDYNSNSSVWAQDKWKGQFHVLWIYVKDVPNPQLRNILLENNENKPVTNSRDTQEVPYLKGCQVLRIIHNFAHSTSIFDDFIHYEKRQEAGDYKKNVSTGPVNNIQIRQRPKQYNNSNHYHYQNQFPNFGSLNKMTTSFKSRDYYYRNSSNNNNNNNDKYRNYDREQNMPFFSNQYELNNKERNWNCMVDRDF